MPWWYKCFSQKYLHLHRSNSVLFFILKRPVMNPPGRINFHGWMDHIIPSAESSDLLIPDGVSLTQLKVLVSHYYRSAYPTTIAEQCNISIRWLSARRTYRISGTCNLIIDRRITSKDRDIGRILNCHTKMNSSREGFTSWPWSSEVVITRNHSTSLQFSFGRVGAFFGRWNGACRSGWKKKGLTSSFSALWTVRKYNWYYHGPAWISG